MHPLTEKYSKKWLLELESETITNSAIICFCQYKNIPAILKIPFSHSDEIEQQVVLAHFKDHGSVPILKSDDNALLLQRLLPGNHLIDLTIEGKDTEATTIFCQVAQKLHQANHSLKGFKSLASLATSFDQYIISDAQQIHHDEIIKARMLFSQLLSSQKSEVLLHGDLHHDNILYDQTLGWLAIDPKGYVGEPAFEAGAWLRNPIKYSKQLVTKEVIAKRITTIVTQTGWSRERIIAWGYVQAILSVIWFVEDNNTPAGVLETARMLRSII